MKKIVTSLVITAALVLTSVVAHADSYRVNRGDTLSKIGSYYGVSYQAIMRANNMTCTTIHPGQVLTIPKAFRSPSPAPQYVKRAPQPVQSNYVLPNPRYDNTSNYGSRSNSRHRSGSSYTVRRGDTIIGISKKYRVSARDLRVLNNLRSENIFPGQVLKLPRVSNRNTYASY